MLQVGVRVWRSFLSERSFNGAVIRLSRTKTAPAFNSNFQRPFLTASPMSSTVPTPQSSTTIGADSSAGDSSSGQARRGRGGKFAKRNAKRKARRDGTNLNEDGTENDPNAPQGKRVKTAEQIERDSKRATARSGNSNWMLNKDLGGFMVAPPDCPKFMEYYRAQNILSEEEWPAFLESLRTKLPTTFRLSTINGMHYNLLHQLTHELQVTPEENAQGGANSYTCTDAQSGHSWTIDPPQRLPWYPDGLGWYIRAGKSELKTKGNKFELFRKFLMNQNDQGNLNRQEAVSMIPPLLLDVQPHHIVLDMCAAPGSKTAQLLEGLHGGITLSDTFKTPSGMVIANDADYKRAYLLVHQLKRYGSSAFLVTTHDGQQFPNLYQKSETTEDAATSTSASSTTAVKSESTDAPAATTPAEVTRRDIQASMANPQSTLYGSTLVQFDRILCDVPCSGDGTLRKNMNLWNIWDTKFANGLHFLQLMIACRALEMLKVGGLMVYSTCSFNPIENESVVMELCRRCNGNLEIVDVSQMLPGLIRRPGLTTWKVRDTHEDRWASPDEESIQNGTHKILKKSMFPPSPEEVEKYQLQRCMRIVPQAQDTGGFFITLLRKTGETPHCLKQMTGIVKVESRANGSGVTVQPSPSPTNSDDAAVGLPAEEAALAESVLAELPDLDGEGGIGLPAGLDDPQGSNSHKAAQHKKNLQQKEKKFNEDPFQRMNTETVTKILDFYGLQHDGVDHSNFFTRSDGDRKCYFVAPAIAKILNCPRNAHKLKIVHTGSRCYERGSKPDDPIYPCQYRIVQEGVESILPFMTKQIWTPPFKEAMALLWKHAWSYKDMKREGNPEETAFFKSIIQHKNGCVVMMMKGSEIMKHSPSYTSASAAINSDDQTVVAAASSTSSSSTMPARRSVPLCIWKTPHSISLMISPVEQKSLLHLLDPTEQFIPPEVKLKRDAERAAEAAKEEERKKKQAAYKQTAAAAATTTTAAPTASEPSTAAMETDSVDRESSMVRMEE